jgi:hypothetical protein
MADPLSSECGPAQEPAPEYRGSVNYRIPQAVKAISYFGQQWGSTLFLKSMWQNGAISLRPEGVAHEKKGRFSFPRVGKFACCFAGSAHNASSRWVASAVSLQTSGYRRHHCR